MVGWVSIFYRSKGNEQEQKVTRHMRENFLFLFLFFFWHITMNDIYIYIYKIGSTHEKDTTYWQIPCHLVDTARNRLLNLSISTEMIRMEICYPLERCAIIFLVEKRCAIIDHLSWHRSTWERIEMNFFDKRHKEINKINKNIIFLSNIVLYFIWYNILIWEYLF